MTYKTAAQLGIKPLERKWLLRFAKFALTMKPHKPKKVKGDGLFVFDMMCVSEPDIIDGECGSIGCIWGGAHLMARAAGESPWGKGRHPSRGHSDPLHKLFFPDNTLRYESITPKIAAQVTLKYLRTGRVHFPKEL